MTEKTRLEKAQKYAKERDYPSFGIEREVIHSFEAGWNACQTEMQSRIQPLLGVLKRVAEYGPPQGIKEEGIACAFCDMGGAGYASRGDGFHDDACAIKDAQILLSEWEKNK